MLVSDYLVDCLINLGVTDVFGIPGGVILDFIYAIDKRKFEINVHLSFHEQSAAFSASGYAQVSGNIGVVYATRGPGMTNLLTAIADAYYDSIPVIVITAHTFHGEKSSRRIDLDQELDSERVFDEITKHYEKIDCLDDVALKINKTCSIALSGRKGPVVLDFNKSVLSSTVDLLKINKFSLDSSNNFKINQINISKFEKAIQASKRPVFLLGDGIHQSNTESEIMNLIKNNHIPAISSRFSQDIIPESKLFFGYIGSHGLRYSNFILEKADLIIALGNRLSFPITSKSFRKIIENKVVFRFEIDSSEISRELPGVNGFQINLREAVCMLSKADMRYRNSDLWIEVCKKLKEKLNDCDVNEPVQKISNILKKIPKQYSITCDVGNNEFWVSRAYAYSIISNRILFSKSFGALGSSLSKAIGVYYKKKQPVICFTGDQGLQMNIQEIQFLVRDKLPIMVVVLNNYSSGMIRSQQVMKYDSNFLHTTTNSGYSVPNFESIAKAYGIEYVNYDENLDVSSLFSNIEKPMLLEVLFDENFDLFPYLPLGNTCQNLFPYLDSDLYNELERL